jgi:toluene monooxygenase system protein E
MSQTPARKLRTWSGFGQIRRKPSEYEIVTHDANECGP